MSLLTCSAKMYPAEFLADIINRAFTGYLEDIIYNGDDFSLMAKTDGLDLRSSQILLQNDEIAGIALLATRGWNTRLAAMGIFEKYRKQGLGNALMQHIIALSRKQNQHRMYLEVIEQNTHALALYEKLGFKPVKRLIGFNGTPETGSESPDLEEINPHQVAHEMMLYAPRDLPWQIAGETLCQLPATHFSAWKRGPASIIISRPAKKASTIKGIVVHPESQRKGHATALLQALFAKYPDITWHVSMTLPEDVAPGLFENLGFKRHKFSQKLMCLDLSADSDGVPEAVRL